MLNYPKIRTSHNTFEVYLGNLTKKEKKVISLETKIFLNNPNIKLCLPLLESIFHLNLVNFEIYQSTKMNNSGLSCQKYLISPINLSIPLINHYKEPEISNGVYLRFALAIVSDILNEGLDMLKM